MKINRELLPIDVSSIDVPFIKFVGDIVADEAPPFVFKNIRIVCPSALSGNVNEKSVEVVINAVFVYDISICYDGLDAVTLFIDCDNEKTPEHVIF